MLIQKFDAIHQTFTTKKKVTLFVLNDYILICLRNKNTFRQQFKTDWKKYSYIETINIHNILRLLIYNDESTNSTNGNNGNNTLLSSSHANTTVDLNTSTESKRGILSNVGTSTNLTGSSKHSSKLDKEENLTGLGLLYKVNHSDENSQFLWYNINILGDKGGRSKNLTSSKNSNSSSTIYPTVHGRTYKTNYSYINALKDVIVDVMCKCKGKLTSDDMVKQVSKEDVKQLVTGGDSIELTTTSENLISSTPQTYESISDLSMISDSAISNDGRDRDRDRENRTPSPTLSYNGTFGSTHVHHGHSGHHGHNVTHHHYGTGGRNHSSGSGAIAHEAIQIGHHGHGQNSKSFVKKYQDSRRNTLGLTKSSFMQSIKNTFSNKLSRNMSFSKLSPRNEGEMAVGGNVVDGRPVNGDNAAFLTPKLPSNKVQNGGRVEVNRVRSATRPNVEVRHKGYYQKGGHRTRDVKARRFGCGTKIRDQSSPFH